MTTSMPHSLDRRQLVRRGAIFLGAAGALSLLGNARADAQSSLVRDDEPPTKLPLQPEFPTSPVDALPEPVRRNNNLERAMCAAIDVAKRAANSFGYGAVLVDVSNGEIVWKAANTGGADPSAHAELNALREFSINRGSFTAASSTILVTTAEPCSMCATCALFARVAGVAYGTSLEFLMAQPGNTVPRISMPQVVATLPPSDPRISTPVVGGVLHEETDQLFEKK
ncbi:tRNA(Arg) A34 adenosine deaminase TadA [Catenulispora sp. MAP12-49]|uniref:nucleoside deaminase n=1 Tax=unclassified Catenulispora TaxID=414885 RepID=UPI003517B860